MQNIEEISNGLQILWSQVNSFAQKVGDEASQQKVNEDKWSIAEEFGHMILSATPIAKASNSDPKEFINLDYPRREGLDYNGLKAYYEESLNLTTTIAPSRFTPLKEDSTSWDEQILKWNAVGKSLTKGLAKWNEKDLDLVQLKHPLLGFLTFREMLFFTHIHSLHHLKGMEHKAFALSGLG